MKLPQNVKIILITFKISFKDYVKKMCVGCCSWKILGPKIP